MSDPVIPAKVTMRTLASRLGVSRATISLALRNNKQISPQTIAKVKQLAKELNYRPDPAISANAASHWSKGCEVCYRKIAFLIEEPANSGIAHDECLLPARQRASEFGYDVEPFNISEYDTAEAATAALEAKKIRGILIPRIRNPHCIRIRKIDWSRFTSVCCGIGRAQLPLHSVADNVFSNTRLLWQIAASAGFKRIGAIIHRHSPVAENDWYRLGASIAATKIHGLTEAAQIPLMSGSFESDEEIYDWYHAHKPEVIIGFNHSTAETLLRIGVRIPQDAELLLLATIPGSPWTGFNSTYARIAENAVDLLVSEICNNHWGIPMFPQFVLVTPQWNTGTSFTHPSKALDEFIEEHLISPVHPILETFS